MNTKLTRAIGLALCLIVELPASAAAQTSIAQDLVTERAHYGALMSRAEIGTMLNAVTWKHRAEGYGLLQKDGGNNCPTPAGRKVSCDWIVNRTTGRGGDVLGSATNDDGSPAPATPSFNQAGTFDRALFVEPVEPAGGGDPTDIDVSKPPTGSDSTALEILLLEQVNELKEIREALAVTNAKLDTQAALTVDTNAKLEQLRKDLIKATKDLVPQLLKILPLLGSIGR